MKYFSWLLILGLIIRLILINTGTLGNDMASWQGWAHRLTILPTNQFYESWSDYLPGYLYILGGLGRLGTQIFLFKLPAIIFDLLGGVLIYIIGRRFKIKPILINLSVAVYLFNPAVFAVSAMWGQIDSIPVFLSSLAIYLFYTGNIFAGIILGLAIATKPTAIVAVMVIGFYGLYKKNFRNLFVACLLSLVTFVSLFIPFLPANKSLISFISERIQQTSNQYPYASVNAFNYWSLIGFNWSADQFQVLGWVLFLSASLFITLFVVKKYRLDIFHLYLLQGLYSLMFFFWLTRMHERHLTGVFLPLAIASLSRPSLLAGYAVLSLGFVTNLHYAFIWITQNFKEIYSKSAQQGLSLFVPLGTLLLFKIPKLNVGFNYQKTNIKISKLWLVPVMGILIFTRLWRLDYPPKYYFDEVYHAFTASEMLKNNHAAWEWWNTPPVGFAYEWTHPPVAKEFMVTGFKLFSSWRLPGAFIGILTGIILYFVVYQVTKNQSLSTIALLLYSIDGLSLTMSRIGMNDIYVVFFLLLTWLLLLRKRKFWASVMYGLALSSKWTALYFAPVFLYYLGSSIYYLIIPVGIYLAVYIPFFSFGNNFAKFIELQQQMWWYHTGLKATHGYSSPAWTWPLMLRPVWAHVEYLSKSAANIYLMGNPLLMWLGLGSVLWQIKKINHFTLGYGLFLLPWLVSPRIMFYYHYLPSAAMLYILLAIWLTQIRNKKIFYAICILLVVSFVFFLPRYYGLSVPSEYVKYWEWLPGWK